MTDPPDDYLEQAIATATRAMRDAAIGSEDSKGRSPVTDLSADWEPPDPLEPACPPVPDFPTDALPDVVACWITAVAAGLEIPVAMAGMAALGTLSAATCGRLEVDIPTGTDFTVPAHIYAAVIAAPGERKSPTMRQALVGLSAALDILQETHPHHLVTQAQLLRDIATKLRRDAVKAKTEAARDKLIAEAAQQMADADELDPGPVPRLWVTDTNAEALEDLLALYGGRFAILSDEAGTLDSFGRYTTGHANLDVVLKGHDGDRVELTRVSRAASIPEAHLTFLLMMQPIQLTALADPYSAGRGLAARFLYAWPESRVGTRKLSGRPIDPEVRDTWRELTRDLCIDMYTRREKVTLELDPDALAMLDLFHHRLEPRLAADLEPIQAWGNKLPGAVARLAGLLHVAHPDWSDHPAVIGAETMAGAVAIGEFAIPHAMRSLAMVEASPTLKLAHRIVSWLVDAGWPSQVTRRDIARQFRAATPAEIDEVLEVLVEHAWVRQERQPNRRVVLHINPNPP